MSPLAWLVLFGGIGAIIVCVAMVMMLEDDTRPKRK